MDAALRDLVWRREEHFARQGPLIVGITATGRVTLQLLRMNDDERLVLRESLQAAGEL